MIEQYPKDCESADSDVELTVIQQHKEPTEWHLSGGSPATQVVERVGLNPLTDGPVDAMM